MTQEPLRFDDVRVYLTAVGEHTCPQRHISVKDEQGITVQTTFVGMACACGAEFLISLAVVKCIRQPLRPYFTMKTAREAVAERFNNEPAKLLLEMRNSGGWDQPHPGVAMFTMLAAAVGPKGNPMEKRLQVLFAPLPKPS